MAPPVTLPPWHDGHVRLFLSHSAAHKAFAAEVAARLLPLGISAFVAHDSMQVTQPWQEQIERALRTAHAFTVLLHPEAKDSEWCQQEIGWALGRDLPFFVIRIGVDPGGFPGRDQWPSGGGQKAQEIARMLAGWLNSHTPLAEQVAGGLLAALRAAGGYIEAGRAGEALDALGDLTPAQWSELDEIFLENDQVHGSVLAQRALRPLYDRAGRSFPSRTP